MQRKLKLKKISKWFCETHTQTMLVGVGFRPEKAPSHFYCPLCFSNNSKNEELRNFLWESWSRNLIEKEPEYEERSS